jgi:hypothetical protein
MDFSKASLRDYFRIATGAAAAGVLATAIMSMGDSPKPNEKEFKCKLTSYEGDALSMRNRAVYGGLRLVAQQSFSVPSPQECRRLADEHSRNLFKPDTLKTLVGYILNDGKPGMAGNGIVQISRSRTDEDTADRREIAKDLRMATYEDISTVVQVPKMGMP